LSNSKTVIHPNAYALKLQQVRIMQQPDGVVIDLQ
jgi:hypothetical protein